MSKIKRRDFFVKGALATAGGAALGSQLGCDSVQPEKAGKKKGKGKAPDSRDFNGPYAGPWLNRVAFPIGGLGAGMVCLEGTGCISHVSVRNSPEVFNQPYMFAAFSAKGVEHSARVLEGPVAAWKIFGARNTGNGAAGASYGFPRFRNAEFHTHFPFGSVELHDERLPFRVTITGWSPFIPGNADDSGLPVGCLEYSIKNTSGRAMEGVFSYHAFNFMRIELPSAFGGNYEQGGSIGSIAGGFLLRQRCFPDKPHYKGDFAIFTNREGVVTDHSLFRGGWFDAPSILWKDIVECNLPGDEIRENSQGASLYVPVSIGAGETVTVPVFYAWYVPHSNLRRGSGPDDVALERLMAACGKGDDCCPPEYTEQFFEPWYSSRFEDIHAVADYWKSNYRSLREKSETFSKAFYGQTLPPEVLEAVAANLTILKSPTVLRQKDGRLWAWEGCHDSGGCCHGSCTHVWNYAQAIPHLFPELERSLRETEFTFSQNEEGHQTFRANMPIRRVEHGFHAAADGQLGGIMKMYREWRISGDTAWMKSLYPRVAQSLDYCIHTWDPKGKGVLEEPHHNTYDIEFWGPDGMCTSFYLGALAAIIAMGEAIGEEVGGYRSLLSKGIAVMESELYDGEYFIQKIVWEGLQAPSPVEAATDVWNVNYSEEALDLLKKEGPKYQYGIGCLSDGVLGSWIARMCGLDDPLDREKVLSHLVAIHNYNLKTDLSDHVNPQRPSYALGEEGGLLLCTWPKGGRLTLPFVYSNEVWTGIEYQVASHLMLMGEVDKGLEIVQEVRKRYDGRVRNPFNEYECGHWYARAMASYGMIQGLTGLRYDAVDKVLYIDSKIGSNFRAFLSTERGYGLAGLKSGKPYLEVLDGRIDVARCLVSGKEMMLG